MSERALEISEATLAHLRFIGDGDAAKGLQTLINKFSGLYEQILIERGERLSAGGVIDGGN